MIVCIHPDLVFVKTFFSRSVMNCILPIVIYETTTNISNVDTHTQTVYIRNPNLGVVCGWALNGVW